MALYITMQIEEGGLNYLALFSIPRYLQFKEDVDAMLVVDGKQNLIVELV